MCSQSQESPQNSGAAISFCNRTQTTPGQMFPETMGELRGKDWHQLDCSLGACDSSSSFPFSLPVHLNDFAHWSKDPKEDLLRASFHALLSLLIVCAHVQHTHTQLISLRD